MSTKATETHPPSRNTTLATEENIRSALAHIPPDLQREEWVRMAMAVKDGLNGSGFEVFNEWSQNGQSYSEADTLDTWKSLNTDGGVKVGTLFYVAKQHGWKPGEAHHETDTERLERERQRNERTAKDAKTKADKEKAAAGKTAALCDAATPALTDNPYLQRKGNKPVETLHEIEDKKATAILRYVPKSDGVALTGRLLIAPIEKDGKIVSAELIDEAGRKSAIAGGAKAGGYWTVQPLPNDDGTGLVLLIGEGVATVLSAKQATEYAAIAALSAGNLPKVAKVMRERYPAARLIILADIGNGQKYAEQAARETCATLAIPAFAPDQIRQFQESHDKAPVDFNDLHQLVGIGAVKDQIVAAESSAVGKAPLAEEKNSENKKNPTPSYTKQTKARNSKGSNECTIKNNPTQKATPKTKTIPNPTPIKPGVFVFINEDSKACRVIESKASKILSNLLKAEGYAWNSDAASWHRFDGSCWAPLPSASEPERVILMAMFEGCEPVGFKQSYFNGVVNIMLRAGLIPLPPEPVGKIPFRNGLLDMESRKLELIASDNAATWAIPHNYHPGTNCPAFMAWIQSATGDDAGLIKLLRAFINACLTGRADLQKFLHLLGPGGTGKSTFIRLLFAILGPSNCVTTDLLHLEQNRFETACIYGKRLTAITDSDKYGGSVNVLKALTGQDPVGNERKNVQQSGNFTYTGMVLIASNEPLASTDYTSGLERRRLVVKFERRIPPEEKAAFVAAGGEEKLHQEIPAIINWALELSRDEVTKIFMHPPQASVEAGFESLTAQNPVAEWIADSLVPAPGNWVLIGVREESRAQSGTVIYADADSRLYPNYLKWCTENRREALSLRRFRHAAVDMLRTMGADVVESRRGPGQGISGIRFRAAFESLYPWCSVQDSNLHRCRNESEPTPDISATKPASDAACSGSGVGSVGSAGFFATSQKNISEDRAWDYQNGRWTDA